MIKKLKIKIIALSMASLFLLLTIIVTGMNILNYNSLVKESDEILSLLSQNRGAFPDFNNNKDFHLPPNMSPELPHESRYFSVLLNNYGDIIFTETSKIISVDSSEAAKLAKEVIKKEKRNGFADNFRYQKTTEEGTLRITFLDCGRKLDAFYGYLLTSVLMALFGYIIVFIIFVFISGRIIKPIAESYEKQKRFITDAGHEIKTPLTIISANVDVLEMDIGKNECLEDIHSQTEKLSALTNDLVMLAKMEESETPITKIDSPVSEIILNTAVPFKTLAQSQNKELTLNIEPMLTANCNSKAIEHLVSILAENALKYSPENSEVQLNFYKQNKNLVLLIKNKTENEITPQNLNRIFDRFYRTDNSRNSESGGHGIGLSVAKAIVCAHGGKIQASIPEEQTFCITAVFPL